MTPWLVLDVVFWVVAGFWVWIAVRMTREVIGLRRLPDPDSPAGPQSRPSVTVVIPVRDGARQIEPTVAELLGQTGVALDVVVVNDRSSDGTRQVIDRLAAGDDRVAALHVDHLPNGWLGKCHALHVGSQAARGEWILLADADLRMTPETLQRAIRLACDERADHVSVLFRPRKPGLLAESCFNNFCLAALNADYGGVNRDRQGSFGGTGAFNLVRTEAFRAVGGYEPLRMTVCDDSRIGKLLNAGGFRSRLFVGPEVTAEWGDSVRSNVKLLEKNMFAATEYRPTFAIGVSLLFILLPWCLGFAGGVAGFLWGSVAGLAAAAGLALTALPALLLAQKCEGARAAALLCPLLWPVLVITVLNSTLVTLRQGGVRWRETFYPLSELRRLTYI